MTYRPLPLFFTLLALAACPRPPLQFGPEGELKDPKEILARMDARTKKINAIKAEAKVRVETPQQSGTVGEFIAAMRPSAVHLETLNFFGKPVAVLASDGERFSLFAEDQGAFYTGPATPVNVSKLMPLLLAPEELVLLLLGDVPRIPAREATVALDIPKRAYVVTLTLGKVSQKLWVSVDDFLPLRSELRGAPAYDVAWSDYEKIGELRFPTTIELQTTDALGQKGELFLRVRYKDTELNPAADLSLFVLEQPPGTEKIELDAEGRQVKDGQTQQPPALQLPLQPDAEKKNP